MAAFVNFINVEDLLLFAQTKLGVKWFVNFIYTVYRV